MSSWSHEVRAHKHVYVLSAANEEAKSTEGAEQKPQRSMEKDPLVESNLRYSGVWKKLNSTSLCAHSRDKNYPTLIQNG